MKNFLVRFYIMDIQTNSLLNKEKPFIIYIDFSMCIVGGGDVSVSSHCIQHGAYAPCWIQCNEALGKSWTDTVDCGFSYREMLVQYFFLKTLDEVTVSFSAEDVWEICVS